MQLISNVWKQAARHRRLEDFMPEVADAIAKSFPISQILVRRLDTRSNRLDTVWVSSHDESQVPRDLRDTLDDSALNTLLEWFGKGELLRVIKARAGLVVSSVLPDGWDGEVVLGLLAGEAGPLGVAALLASPGARFSQGQCDLARMMMEPLGVALFNDVTFHRMNRERLAISADKDALLSRLQRQDIAESIVGADAGLRPVIEHVDQVAHTDAPVLVLGETGTGKEVIARAIHSRSRRKLGPMYRVNCGAIPAQLVDSELFGHERGAFTGAVAGRKGWFERADGGTLFLDEVAELPAAAQVRLLRVLQDGSMERVGGQRTFTVDVRIVAATNAPMEELVSSGHFRDDLWYRLSVFPIKLPPLRDRVQDIPALAAHFAWGAGKRLGGTPLAPDMDDLGILVSYTWPGNVRELAAVIERAAILGDGKRLEIKAALGGTVVSEGDLGSMPRKGEEERDGAVFMKLDEVVVEHIGAALERTMGRIEGENGAARLLGVNPHTLRARMKKLGVDWSRYRAISSRDPEARRTD